ncbi:MAG: hypothetical protein Q9219_003416 [cf. Caloplaca sp. 3 TL-2023]
MSVQTRVRVDGRWVTRTLDIHEIIARNTGKKKVMSNVFTGSEPPILGLLTKTVVRSPIIKSIIPARIRHRSKNDVIFIYEDTVVIKEILGGERIENDPTSDVSLDNTVVKNDFDSTINAARIMGLPREPKTPHFPGRFWDGDYRPHSPREIKLEPFGENEVPPQILPVKEKHTRVNGFIIQMEFLHPSEGDEHHVTLLLVVARQQKTRLVRIEWDCRSSLSEIDPEPGQVLPHPDRLPLLLIPLTYGTAFALVCEQQIVVYKDVLTGHANGQAYELEDYEPSEERGSFRRLPIWTQWARTDSSTMITSNYKAGSLNTSVGSAFATLDLGDESNDLLIAAGEDDDGGMWYSKPREPLELVGVIRNWTPLKDLTNTQITRTINGAAVQEGRAPKARERLFACNQANHRGAIIEVRAGIEAVKMGPTIDVEDWAEKGVDKMWALPDRSNIGIYLMVAHPMDTELILLPAASDQDPQVSSDIEELDLDVRTVAAGSTAEGFIIQVTPFSINAIAQEAGIRPFTSKLSNTTVTVACFLTVPTRTTVLVTVVQKNDGFYLHHGHFGLQDGGIAFAELCEPIMLRSEASSLSVYWIDERIVTFVGTLAGTVQVYTAEAGSSFTPYFEYSFDAEFSICDSLAMIPIERSPNVEAKHLLVCGLRDGTVRTLYFNGTKFDDPIWFCEKIEMGTTSVRVFADATRNSRAILVCEQNLYTLEYPQAPSPTNPAVIHKVWMTDPSQPGFWQRPLDCLTQASSMVPNGYSNFAASSLFYLAGNSLLLADISSSPDFEMMPRRIPLAGMPTRSLYSERLKKLIVIYTATATVLSGQASSRRNRTQTKSLRPALAFVDPDAEPSQSASDEVDDMNLLRVTDVKDGERFLGVMEWFPTNGRRQYHMIVINTRVGQAAREEATGRLLLLVPGISNDGKSFVDLKRSLDHDAPVWCVASYGSSSLIYACGEELILQTMNMDTRGRFGSEVKVRLHCPVTHISVDGDVIHVSTKGSGHQILRVEDEKLIPLCAEASGRSDLYHFLIPDKSLVMTADREGRVAGLWQPQQPRLDRTAPLVFECRFPCLMTKFCNVTKPIWQRKSLHLQSQPIIGSSADGGIYQFTILNESAWRLLAFIQNMAKRDSRICPYPDPFGKNCSIEPSAAEKQNMHINGDILARILERGGTPLLEEMLTTEHDPGYKQSGYKRSSNHESADARHRRFQELVLQHFDGQGNGIENTLAFIQGLLSPAI